ncbi:glycosyltransferase [Pseudodesulfovibrio senegalensis]|uniref:Glycosyltransferase n=1 Tax=Pseudodesulfovibrio senegalensis TaxID=1721087 RepID=A0A6N6MZL5_9BACT|nr:glycosyltransferase [Pseudodesulfovibrio senegalensis]KAB1439029.1 glycosyltransferase [Pseudodesulfovibrio senegalensis]
MFRSSVPVLCYHSVSNADGGHSPEQFGEHLDAVLAAGYRTITARDLIRSLRGEMRVPRKSVVVTFDDGHVSNWLHAVPELEKRSMTGVFFALTDFVQPGPIRSLADAPANLPLKDAFRMAHMEQDYSQFVNESEIRAMLDKGMEVHSHGCRHQGCYMNMDWQINLGHYKAHWAASCIYPAMNPDWPTYPVGSAYVYNGFWPVFDGSGSPAFRMRSTDERRDFCRKDFARSMRRIRELTGGGEQLFCWPWGHFDPVAEEELKKAGYAGAFTLERGPNCRGTSPYRIHRLGVGSKKSGSWVQQRLRMYSGETTARVFFKGYHKRPEVSSVLYATDSDKLSGGSRQMINNALAMRDMGLRVFVMIAPDSALNEPLANEDGITVVPFDGFRHYLRAGRFLRDLVRRESIDVVHSFHNRAYKMGVIARLMGAKFKLFINRGVISRPNTVFFLWTALSDGVICNSGKCADVLRSHHVLEKRLNVVYNAYNGPDFGEPRPRHKRSMRILYVGNKAPTKGFDTFIEACRLFAEAGPVRDVEFAGVGGLASDALEQLLARPEFASVRERLSLPGRLPHAEVLDEMRHADMLVVSSRMESLPNTLIEAFDLGLPVICTRAGGMPELVRDGVNGFLCEIGDSAAIAARMRELADDFNLRLRMGIINHRIVRGLLLPRHKAANLMSVYQGFPRRELLDIDAIAARDIELPQNEEHDHHDHGESHD